MLRPPLEIKVNKDGTVWLCANTYDGRGMLSITKTVHEMPESGTKQTFVKALAEAVAYDTLTGDLQRELDQAARDHATLVEEVGLWKSRAYDGLPRYFEDKEHVTVAISADEHTDVLGLALDEAVDASVHQLQQALTKNPGSNIIEVSPGAHASHDEKAIQYCCGGEKAFVHVYKGDTLLECLQQAAKEHLPDE